MKRAVFTDLDGTFLDHQDYSYSAALPAVRRLQAAGVPLFSVSSKTLAEQLDLFEGTGIFSGYVAENGGVVHLNGETTVVGPSRQQVDATRAAIERALGTQISSFRPECLTEVVEATGLTEKQALLACERLCSDPLLLQAEQTQLMTWIELAKSHGTVLVHGGRFLTICGQSDKGEALRWVVRQVFGDQKVLTLALGDSENDLSLLRAADRGVWLPNPHGHSPSADRLVGLGLADRGGPEGWCLAVSQWLGEA